MTTYIGKLKATPQAPKAKFVDFSLITCGQLGGSISLRPGRSQRPVKLKSPALQLITTNFQEAGGERNLRLSGQPDSSVHIT